MNDKQLEEKIAKYEEAYQRLTRGIEKALAERHQLAGAIAAYREILAARNDIASDGVNLYKAEADKSEHP